VLHFSGTSTEADRIYVGTQPTTDADLPRNQFNVAAPNGPSAAPPLPAPTAAAEIGTAPSAAPVPAAPGARLVQRSDGALFLIRGTNSWSVVPESIGDDELATLSPGQEVDGLLPLVQPGGARIVQASDGSYYVLEGGAAQLLLPDQINDVDLAALSLGGELDGTIPADLLAPVGVPDGTIALPETGLGASGPDTGASAPPPSGVSTPAAPAQAIPAGALGPATSQACVTPRLAPAALNAAGVSSITDLDNDTIAQQAQSRGDRWAVIYSDDAVGASMLRITQAALQSHGGPQPFTVIMPVGEPNVLPYASRIPRDGTIQVLLLALRTTNTSSSNFGNDLGRVLSVLLQVSFNQRMAIVICAT
jgi:hypothetical protein